MSQRERDTSRDHSLSGEIATTSSCERNLAILALPSERVRVNCAGAWRLAPFDLGCDQPSRLLLAQRLAEPDAPRQARRG